MTSYATFDGLLALGVPDGSSWSVAPDLGSLRSTKIWAFVGSDRVRLILHRPGEGIYYTESATGRFADNSAYATPVSLPGAGASANPLRPLLGGSALAVTFRTPYTTYAQRCPLEADCTLPDGWLPEAMFVAGTGIGDTNIDAVSGGADAAYVHWCSNGQRLVTRGFGSGSWWSTSWSWSGTTGCGNGYLQPTAMVGTLAASDSSISMLDIGSTTPYPTIYDQSPALTPSDVVLDVGSDGVAELALAAPSTLPMLVSDLAPALNAYLATHGDADDGTVDGLVTVPVSVSGRGTGGIVLRDLEVRYQLASTLAAFAEPSLFSPGGSPGVLDATALSVLATGDIVVTDASGAPRRTLSTVASGGRFVAQFDGRDGGGNVVSSGLYRFGVAGNPTGEVEIDDVPPTVELRASAEGQFGGVADVYGRATDSDWAGTSKNFARYVLAYSLDGAIWTTIATSTKPADGLLGRWDTRQVPSGAATLRLTAYDRAGNSSTTSRGVGVSGGAPLAPVIDSPTVAGRPLDVLGGAVAIAGTAEVGTVVTVFVNGAPVGTVPSDGRWSLAGVTLPPGLAAISASATRAGLESPRAQDVIVARYALALALDLPATGGAGSALSGTATVTRASVSGGAVTVRLSATDITGAAASIGLVPTEQVVSPPATGSALFDLHVGAPGVRPGIYTLRAEIVSGGRTPAVATKEVAFTSVGDLSATLYSDKAVYRADQLVGLEARVANGSTAPTGDLHALISVIAPSGRQAVLGPYSIASIPAGSARTIGALFGTPPLEVGLHLAELSVLDEWENVVATAGGSFDVGAGSATTLSGTLNVTPPVYAIGQPLQADWTITNGGGTETVAVSTLLVRAADGLVFTRQDGQVTVPAGATSPGSILLSTVGTDGQEIVAILLGNGRGLAAQTIAPVPVPDTAAPVISFKGVIEGEYATSVAPVVVVTDESAYSTQLTLNGETFVNGTTVTMDAEYVLSVVAIDVWGNEARAARHFVVDTLAPAITVAGAIDGGFATSAMPVVTVTELHPKTQVLLLDGVGWDGAPVTSEGDHVLEIHAEDLAGNVADARIGFSIDRTAPVISIEGVQDGAVYGGPAQPLVTVTDAHPSVPPWSATLNGASWAGGVVVADGDWTLAVDATDVAGNTASPAQVRFAVDTTPPVIHVSGVTDGLLTRNSVTPIVTVDEPHPGTSTVLLDGAPFSSGTPVTAEGPHRLTVAAVDAVGNSAAPVSVEFARDSTAPGITISGVADGGTYLVDATPTFAVTDLHLVSSSATLDGQPFTSGTRVAAGGYHTLRVDAGDAAGNTSTATVGFTVVVVNATVTASVDVDPRVVIAVNCAGQPGSCPDTQARVLFGALDGAGIPYEYALDSTSFLQKVRENRHNVRVLYRSSSSATNLYGELRELTYSGGGLIVVNDASPDADPKLRETIGVSSNGGTKSVGAVTFTAGDLGPARTMTVSGSGVMQNLLAATAKVAGTASKGPVATTNRYGSGHAVTLTFNPELNDNASMRDLLVQSVWFAAGAAGTGSGALPAVPQYVKLASTLSSPPGPIDVQLDAWPGSGLLLLTDAGAQLTPPRTWTFGLSATTPVTQSVSVTASQPGTYPVLGELGVVAGGASKLVAQTSIEIVIAYSISDLKARSIDATTALSSSTARTNALTELNAVDPNPATKTACDTAIAHAVSASDYLISIGTAALDARARTDELLRSLQALYKTLP